VRYTLKTPYRDGTTHVVFESLDFIARLASLVPRPWAHLTRYNAYSRPTVARGRRSRLQGGARSRRGTCGPRPSGTGLDARRSASRWHRGSWRPSRGRRRGGHPKASWACPDGVGRRGQVRVHDAGGGRLGRWWSVLYKSGGIGSVADLWTRSAGGKQDRRSWRPAFRAGRLPG